MQRQPDLLALMQAHAIQAEESCVAWGYELIAKWHGRLDWNQYPLQTENPKGMGFSAVERKSFQGRFGILTEERHLFPDDLLAMVKEQCDLERPPLLSVFSRATVIYDPDGIGAKRDFHIFVGLAESLTEHCFGTRCLGHGEPVFIYLQHIKAFHGWAQTFPDPSPRIHCLLHRL